MAPKRAPPAPPVFNFSSFADFLGSAIKDAGAGAALPSSNDLPTPAPASAPISAPTPAPTQIQAPTQAQVPAQVPVPTQVPVAPSTTKARKKNRKQAEKAKKAVTHTRKLVTIKKISTIENFNCENNLIKIEGWEVVMPKTKEVSQGELVIFIETDTFLPAGGDSPRAFAEVENETVFEGRKGFLVKPRKHTSIKNDRVVLSQGHIYRLSEFPRIWDDYNRRREKFEAEHGDDFGDFVATIRGVDFTRLLHSGVCKWISDAERAAAIPGPATGPAVLNRFPSFINKVNVTRVQNCPNLFLKEKYVTQVFQETLKMDGSSMTIYFLSKDDINNKYEYRYHIEELSNFGMEFTTHESGRLSVCSRERDLPFDGKSPYWQAALEQNYHTILPNLGTTIAIQGELVGHNIQGNPHNYPPDSQRFFVYSIFEPNSKKQWDPRKVEAWAAEQGVDHVPVYGYRIIPHIARHHEDLLIRADMHKGDEGLVFKNCDDGRWFKVLSRLYLMDKEAGDKPVVDTAGKGKGNVEDDYEGYEMPDDEFDQLIEDYESGALDNDPGVQAFVNEWEKNWYSVPCSTIPKRLLGIDNEERIRRTREWLRI